MQLFFQHDDLEEIEPKKSMMSFQTYAYENKLNICNSCVNVQTFFF